MSHETFLTFVNLLCYILEMVSELNLGAQVSGLMVLSQRDGIFLEVALSSPIYVVT